MPWAITWDGSAFAWFIFRVTVSFRMALTKYSLSCSTMTFLSSSKESTCASVPKTPGSVSSGLLKTEDRELLIQQDSILFARPKKHTLNNSYAFSSFPPFAFFAFFFRLAIFFSLSFSSFSISSRTGM